MEESEPLEGMLKEKEHAAHAGHYKANIGHAGNWVLSFI